MFQISVYYMSVAKLQLRLYRCL